MGTEPGTQSLYRDRVLSKENLAFAAFLEAAIIGVGLLRGDPSLTVLAAMTIMAILFCLTITPLLPRMHPPHKPRLILGGVTLIALYAAALWRHLI